MYQANPRFKMRKGCRGATHQGLIRGHTSGTYQGPHQGLKRKSHFRRKPDKRPGPPMSLAGGSCVQAEAVFRLILFSKCTNVIPSFITAKSSGWTYAKIPDQPQHLPAQYTPPYILLQISHAMCHLNSSSLTTFCHSSAPSGCNHQLGTKAFASKYHPVFSTLVIEIMTSVFQDTAVSQLANHCHNLFMKANFIVNRAAGATQCSAHQNHIAYSFQATDTHPNLTGGIPACGIMPIWRARNSWAALIRTK
jgi:hypothetical protein